MANTTNDIKILEPTTPKFSVKSIVTLGTTASIDPGVPTFRYDASGASWTGAVRVGTDGEGTTSQAFTGIAKSTSTETTGVAGSVYTWIPFPGMVYSGQALTWATYASTQALIDGLVWKRVYFDLSATRWTVDTQQTDAVTSALVIVGGDYRSGAIYFTVKHTCTALGQIA